MAIRQGGVTVIDDSRNIVNANTVMLNGDFTPYANEGPNILWSAAGSLVSTFDNPNAYDTTASDFFGYSVAIDNDIAIIGAYGEDVPDQIISGVAYLFNVKTNTIITKISNPDPVPYFTSAGDQFGISVAISGNYAIVGSPVEGPVWSGKAYIFNAINGALVHTLNNPNAYGSPSNDQFANSVAISGNFAIVGTQYESDAGGNNSGKAYIYNVTTGALVHTLNNPNAYSVSSGDQFANSVAISGNYAIVGSQYEDDAGGTGSGKAYIFNVTTGVLVWTLNNPNAYDLSAGDAFGQSVAISDNFAIVGVPFENDAGGSASGKAYIYNVTTGALVWTLNNPNAYSTSAGDQFGWSVAISGNFAIVGAQSEDDASGASSGKAYIYNVTTGALVWTLNNPNAYSTSFDELFGSSVAISNNYAIVGAWREDDVGGTQSGKAYTFALNTTYRTGKPITTASDFGYVRKNAAGSLVWTLNNPNAYDTSANDNFGDRVAISGNYAIVGSQYEDDAGGTGSGKAYIFNVTTGALLYTLNNPNAYSTSVGDQFGISVAISDNYAVVGAQYEDDTLTSLNSTGVVYVYNTRTGNLLYSIRNPQLDTGSYGSNMFFGSKVSISNDYIIATAYGSNGNSGTLYIYNASTGKLIWTLNNPNAYDTSSGDYFGYSAEISGNYAIVGAPFEDDAGGADSGKAYIFNISTGALVWTLNNPNAYSTSAGDFFGWSVAISGNYAIVGSPNEDDASGTESGKAYIFNVITGALVWTLNNPNPVGTSVSDTFGYSVAISGNYAIVGAYQEDTVPINQLGKAYIFNVSTGALIRTFDDPNPDLAISGDFFGFSVAISGNYAIVGAPYEDDAGGSDSGKAYIFSVNDTYRLTNVEEIQLANGMKISADNKLLQQSVPAGALIYTLDNPSSYSTTGGDLFGYSLAISGNYAIVSAASEDETSGNVGSGKVYIFNATTGQLISTLNNPNAYSTSLNDSFGFSVAISGNFAIVGATGEDDAGGTSSGKAYIFNVTTGALIWTLNNPNAYGLSEFDSFGLTIAISANYAVVGTTSEGSASGANSGRVYVFSVSTGNLLWTLSSPNAQAVGYFGSSVAVSGNYVAVGAHLEAGSQDGRAYVFDALTGSLLKTFNGFNNSNFGKSVSISNNYMIVGAPNFFNQGGRATVYDVTSGNLLQTLENPNAYSTNDFDYFGTSVAISGNYAIVSARGEDDSGGTTSGKAYIFNVTTGQLVWTLNNPNAYSTSAGDEIGLSVSISDNYAIVNAFAEDDAGGFSSGKAYIFSVRDLTYLDRLVQMVS